MSAGDRKPGEIQSEMNGSYSALEGLFKDRMLSLKKMRNNLEKVVEEHKNEELIFEEYIQQVLKNPKNGFSGDNSNEEVGSQSPLIQKRNSELEEKFHKEFEKRVKLQKAFITFKTEGNNIIDRLRFALRQVGSKYKKERLKNRHLTKRLNDQLLHSSEIGEGEKFRKLKQLLQATTDELQKYKVQFNRIEEKFVSYKKMVFDHKKVISALKKKLERSEEENQHLRKEASSQRQLISSSSSELQPQQPQQNEEVVINNPVEDSDLRKRLRKYGVEHESSGEKLPAQDVVKDQQALINKLLDRLENEENERLKTEEQSYKIVEEEERTISFLESQIKNLTSNSLLQDGNAQEDDSGLEGMSPIKETVE